MVLEVCISSADLTLTILDITSKVCEVAGACHGMDMSYGIGQKWFKNINHVYS